MLNFKDLIIIMIIGWIKCYGYLEWGQMIPCDKSYCLIEHQEVFY